MNLFKKHFLFTLLLLGSVAVRAQVKQISGTVKNANNEAISNATIQQKGTQNIIAAGGDGAFTISITGQNATLVVSAVGYSTKEVPAGETNLAITLDESGQTNMNEVVVTALGIKREKKALGYAVQDINSEELLKNKNANVINSLNGKIAGLNITNSGGAPGSSASIIIRGGTSLERDNQPLFVIDGIPMDNSTGQGDNSAFDGSTNISTTNGNRAMDINPEDIESISVLKGPAAAALYGLRAAAGAIVITTKKGTQGTVSVNVNSRYTNNWVNRLPEQQAIYKQGSYYNTTTVNLQTPMSWGDKFASGETIYDNLTDFFQKANAFDNSITVSGGSQTGNFFLSASNLMQTGIVPTTDFKRNTVRFNGEQKAGIFTFGVNSSFSMSNTRKTLTGSGLWGSTGTGYFESIVAWPRNDDMKNWINADGTKRRLLPDIPLDTDVDNPYWIINKNPQKDKTNRLVGSVYTKANITSWLEATYRLGIDQYTTKFSSLTYPGSSVKEAWQKGMLSETDVAYNYWNSSFMLNFHKTISDFDVNFLVGHSAENFRTEMNSRRAENFPFPDFTSVNNAAQANKYFNQAITNKRIVGVYGDLRLSYKNFLFLNATGRNDWSSTLPIQNRSFFYPSVSGSFVFTELMDKSDVLSFGKLRASWAKVGKDAPAYQTRTYLFGPELTIGGGYRNGWTRGNPILKPETTTSTEFGTDLRFFRNRLGLEFTYYVNRSIDQILQPRVSNATAYILSYVNTGTIENKGFEITLNGTPVKTNDFTWTSTINFSHNKGRVKELPGSLPILYVTDVQVGNAKAASFDDGYFMGLSGSKWQTDKEGNLLLNWTTGYPLTSTLSTSLVGNREPSFIAGFNNEFSYKNWSLNMLWDFRKGGDVYNGTDYLMTVYGLSKRTENRGEQITFSGMALNPATQKYEPLTKEVIADEKYYRDIYTNNAPFFIEEVNWARLRSVGLSYSLPSTFLAKSKFIKGAIITATGTNLILFTNYSGMDPEISAAGAGVVGSGSVGIDYAGVPATAGFGLGVNIKF